mmetsp:Transcript_3581/g.8850  ORF Transcript_3581/g.8850 Transcript_3581/m.8850 type:complete len:485 (+) Transcript_3581:30-1484(+)
MTSHNAHRERSASCLERCALLLSARSCRLQLILACLRRRNQGFACVGAKAPRRSVAAIPAARRANLVSLDALFLAAHAALISAEARVHEGDGAAARAHQVGRCEPAAPTAQAEDIVARGRGAFGRAREADLTVGAPAAVDALDALVGLARDAAERARVCKRRVATRIGREHEAPVEQLEELRVEDCVSQMELEAEGGAGGTHDKVGDGDAHLREERHGHGQALRALPHRHVLARQLEVVAECVEGDLLVDDRLVVHLQHDVERRAGAVALHADEEGGAELARRAAVCRPQREGQHAAQLWLVQVGAHRLRQGECQVGQPCLEGGGSLARVLHARDDLLLQSAKPAHVHILEQCHRLSCLLQLGRRRYAASSRGRFHGSLGLCCCGITSHCNTFHSRSRCSLGVRRCSVARHCEAFHASSGSFLGLFVIGALARASVGIRAKCRVTGGGSHEKAPNHRTCALHDAKAKAVHRSQFRVRTNYDAPR